MDGCLCRLPRGGSILTSLQLLSYGVQADADIDDHEEEIGCKMFITADRCTLKEIVGNREDCLKYLRRSAYSRPDSTSQVSRLTVLILRN